MTIPKEILDATLTNDLIIFVGSGFSKPLGYLDWNQLANKAIDEFKTDYPNVVRLKQCLAEDTLDEILVFDALHRINATKINKIIEDENNIDIHLNMLSNHKLLWEISSRIITTNYDKALESSKPKYAIPTICHDYKHAVANNFAKPQWLYHIHGRVDDISNCVIFTKNYVELYNDRNPAVTQLKTILQNKTILFIGFSMKDRYVSNLLENLNIIFGNSNNNKRFILLSKVETLPFTYLRKLEIPDYNKIPEFLQELNDSKNRHPQSPVRITRYLRRRCRSFEKGSEQFNQLLSYLLQEPVSDTPEEIEKLTKQFELLNDYEKCILNAALFENLGQIEKMIDKLACATFSGNQELSRILYLAIGLEKIDLIKDALKHLDKIINTPRENEVILSAKFNRNVCYEKINEYDKVRYEDYIDNETILYFTNEKIKDKAIANELIVCHKTKKDFKYQVLLNEELENSLKGSPKSYCKALINYLTYKNESISKDKYDEIYMLSKSMSNNSRVTMLCEIFKKLDDDTQNLIKEEVLIQLEKIVANRTSFATNKHIQELKKYIDDKNYN